MKILQRKFYDRDTPTIAKELLGKVLVHKIGRRTRTSIIVETEAYYGVKDPASRAHKGRITKVSRWMWYGPGVVMIYMVHANWLMNIVTGKRGKPSAVLLRAVEPVNFRGNPSGPGRMTKALGITQKQIGMNVSNPKSEIIVAEDKGVNKRLGKFKIECSHRIGVSRDVKRKLRFFVAGNRFVSK